MESQLNPYTTQHFYREFSTALIDADGMVPSVAVDSDGRKSFKRFAIYRNNVMSSLIEAMEANFPVTLRLIGPLLFSLWARDYLLDHMPSTPVLIRLGSEFSDFLKTYEAAQDLPYLSDVASFEFAWLQAYHAEDTPVLEGHTLGQVPQDKVAQALFIAHPATWLQRSVWPVATIVTRNWAKEDCTDIDLSISEDILITRPNLDVNIHTLPSYGFEFLTALANGESLQMAADAMTTLPNDSDSTFDLAEQIKSLLYCGVFSSVQLKE